MTLQRRAQPWLGTMVEIGLHSETLQAAAFEAAFKVVAAIHQAMSPQNPDSDLGRFNAAGVEAQINCQPITAAVLTTARALAEQTHGVFDATQGRGGPQGWSLQGTWLRKHHPDARLDLGGIAKGYAVDQAVAALQAAGIPAGWVNAGGDLRAFGDLDFPVHIRSLAEASQALPLLALREGAVATSVLLLVDGSQAYVTVAAPECLWADALTKVVAYAPPSVSGVVLARYHAQAWRHAPF